MDAKDETVRLGAVVVVGEADDPAARLAVDRGRAGAAGDGRGFAAPGRGGEGEGGEEEEEEGEETGEKTGRHCKVGVAGVCVMWVGSLGGRLNDGGEAPVYICVCLSGKGFASV